MEDVYITQYLLAEKKHWWWISRRQIVARLVQKTLNKQRLTIFNRALEVGCFSGMNVQALHSYAKEWVGIEPSLAAIQDAHKNVPTLKIHEGLFPTVKAEGKFDAILMLDVLEHIKDSGHAIQNVFSSLERGGSFFVTVPAYMWLWSSFDETNQHHRRYTRGRLVKELRAAGFEIEYAGYFNTLLFIPAALQRLLSKLQKSNSGSGAEIPASIINKIFGFIFSLEKYFLTYVTFPFGLSVIAIARRPR